MRNPFATRKSAGYNYGVPLATPEYAHSSEGFAEPDSGDHSDNGYIDNPASAGAPLSESGDGSVYNYPVGGPDFTHRLPSDGTGTMERLQPSNVEYPSAQRLGFNRYDRRPDEGPPADYYGKTGFEGVPGIDRSEMGGEKAVDSIRQNVNTVLPGDYRWADRPGRCAPASNRLTSDMQPVMYQFERPFDQLNRPYGDAVYGTKRRFTGIHFSMADFRRNYDILTMAPQRQGRNTYRIEPEPWDINQVDVPPDQNPMAARVADVNIPGPSRSYRLS